MTKYTEWYFIFLMKERIQQSKAERTRQFIIQQAAPIFNKKGYAGTSLSDLTSATGLTKGSIYGNFAGKDEVAISAFRYNVQQIIEVFVAGMAQVNSPLEKLRVYPSVYRKLYPAILQQGGCPIMNTAVEADDVHPELRQLVVDTILRWKTSIVSLVEEGIALGEIRRETDANQVADLMITLLEGGGALTKVTGDEEFIVQAIAHVEHLIQSITL